MPAITKFTTADLQYYASRLQAAINYGQVTEATVKLLQAIQEELKKRKEKA